jgi:ABC-2 type transport system permease protein
MSSAPRSDFIAPVGQLLNEQREAQLFWYLRSRVTAATMRNMLTTARLRLSLVAFLSVFFWVGLYVLFYKGFGMLELLQANIVEPLYNAFFLALMLMLVFSSGVILYSSLFCSTETTFLLTTPARIERIYAHKFQEAVWFSSWGFVLLGSPTLVAYGVAAEAPWYYFALLLPFVVAFVHIPAAIGGILCLLVVNRLPSLRKHLLGTALLVVASGVIWFLWMVFSSAEGDLLTKHWFHQLFSRLKFTEQRFLPSWWLSAGLLEATRWPSMSPSSDQPWAQSLLYLSLLVSNALFLNLIGTWLAGKLYRNSYNRLYGETTAKRRTTTWWVDNAVGNGAVFLPHDLRILLVKDFRLFRRDPVQWSQFLIFFGLLGLYILNIHRIAANPMYSLMIGFLNLAVVGLILSTFTTRFIFPMISLEGRQLWILGLLPIQRDTILWAKFVFAAVGSLVPCTLLILLSDLMLQVPVPIIVVHQIACVVLCLGLSAIAVGLGAKMPDLREPSPSKIAAGFGGTLNLVISAIFIVIVILFTALPVHLNLAAQSETFANAGPMFQFLGSPAGIATGVTLTIVAGLISTVWPLAIGLRAFRELEL